MSIQRIRTVKPEFFVHEELAELSLPARFLFVGLWTVADREGRLEDRPRRLKAQIFPYDPYDVEQLLEELAGRGFIRRYTVESQACIDIPAFLKHQRVGNRETPSMLPACPANHQHASACLSTLQQDEAPARLREREREREREGKKKLAIARKEKATTWPPDFTLTEARRRYAERNGLDADYEWGKFKAHAERDNRKHINWDAAWQYWIRNAWELQQRRAAR